MGDTNYPSKLESFFQSNLEMLKSLYNMSTTNVEQTLNLNHFAQHLYQKRMNEPSEPKEICSYQEMHFCPFYKLILANTHYKLSEMPMYKYLTIILSKMVKRAWV
uniref:Uncharacterized protein n=1 Tax=Micrurus carvalhoi TaxID=3147026 RepID=A0A2H6NK92_9SAUR